MFILESYDHQLIVIGGGPAGSTVARFAAEGGVEVLVIDGRDPIGSPLQCGELVPSNDEMRRLCPDVPEMDELFKTPDHAISRHSTQMHLLPPSGRPLKFDFDGYVLNRVAHDEFLVDLAKEAGADYMTNSRVEGVDGHFHSVADDAGGDSGGDTSEAGLYDQAVKLIKRAGKLEKKDKTEKAKKLYSRAFEKLDKAYKKDKKNPDILNYLGFTLRKTGDLEKAEVYYLKGLELDAGHLGINEYLGELYVQTNRIDLAKERLAVLNGCKCEEYDELKELIDNK